MSDDDGVLELPNYTQIPNVLFDELLPTLSLGELRVLLYLLRRTLGFHKSRDAIALRQLAPATGLNRSTVVAAVKALEQKRLIHSERRQLEDQEYLTTIYSVRFRGTPWLENTTTPGGNSTTGVVAPSDLQKKRNQKKREAPESGAVEWARRHGLADD